MDMPLEYGSYKTAWRGLRSGRMKEYGIGYLKRYHLLEVVRLLLLTAQLLRLKGGEVVGYDGFKHRKGSKIRACVDKDSMPLSITIIRM